MAKQDIFCNRSAAAEAHDDSPRSPKSGETIGDIIVKRYSRRDIMRGTLGVAASAALFGPAALAAGSAKAEAAGDRFDFSELEAGVDKTHHVAPGYRAQVLLRWGDPIFPDVPEFNAGAQSAASQEQRFGYNNDYIAYFPIDGSDSHGLLCVNHEYTNEELMFPLKKPRQDLEGFEEMTKDLVDIEMAAHGVTIVEIKREGDDWAVVRDSKYNRRITANTPMKIDGEAAGKKRMRTKDDETGERVLGTLNNCAGGMTPWGTYLTAEENFYGYFWTDRCKPGGAKPKGLGGDQKESYERYKLPGMWQAWGKFYERFDVDKEPNEPNRFGWIVEIDPFTPGSTPVKHTALGRFYHEGAEVIVNDKDKRVVIYCGDDSRGEYVYRFVSKKPYIEGDKPHNMTLLSEGELSVARFDADGKVHWLPLEHGKSGWLTKDFGFETQADVLIDARLAAEKVGATSMDRPEDVQPNERNGRVYVILTNNVDRKSEAETFDLKDRVNPANPRPNNAFGHIIEMTPIGGDHTGPAFDWTILVRFGDPGIGPVGALWSPEVSADGWFACPDNAAVDSEGRLWIATDQGERWPRTGRADGLFGLETEGERRGTPKLFFRCPIGAELCGPRFTKDGETLFVSVQHPAADGAEALIGFGRPSTFKDPVTRWPDFDETMPPRPSVIVITKDGGGKIA
jgi:secreted PhoX family phosphatase